MRRNKLLPAEAVDLFGATRHVVELTKTASAALQCVSVVRNGRVDDLEHMSREVSNAVVATRCR